MPPERRPPRKKFRPRFPRPSRTKPFPVISLRKSGGNASASTSKAANDPVLQGRFRQSVFVLKKWNKASRDWNTTLPTRNKTHTLWNTPPESLFCHVRFIVPELG